MVLRVVAGQAAREVPGGLPPSGASSFRDKETILHAERCLHETWRHQCFVSLRSFVQQWPCCSFPRLRRLPVMAMVVMGIAVMVTGMAGTVTGVVVMRTGVVGTVTGVVVMRTGVVDTGAVMDGAVGGVQASASLSPPAIMDAAAGTRTMAIIPAVTAGVISHPRLVGLK